jgi:predicted metal-dependent hydrolase
VRLHAQIRHGVTLFNEERFWEAHESWEGVWLENRGEERRFLQGLIQLAAAYHHVQRGTNRGAIRLFAAALEKLETYPRDYLRVDRRNAVDTARSHRAQLLQEGLIEHIQYPKLGYN